MGTKRESIWRRWVMRFVLCTFCPWLLAPAFAQNDPAATSYACYALRAKPVTVSLGGGSTGSAIDGVFQQGDKLTLTLTAGTQQSSITSWGLKAYENSAAGTTLASSASFGALSHTVETAGFLAYFLDGLSGSATLTINCEPAPLPAVTCADFSLASSIGPTANMPPGSRNTGGFVNMVPGDTFTVTVSPSTQGDAATQVSWNLNTFDPAVWNGSLPYPLVTVASGGTLGSTLTYKATTAGVLGVVAAVEQSDGWAEVSGTCRNIPPPPSPVPTLSQMALGALVALMAMVAWRSRSLRQGRRR